jgi:hypothetical protein
MKLISMIGYFVLKVTMQFVVARDGEAMERQQDWHISSEGHVVRGGEVEQFCGISRCLGST